MDATIVRVTIEVRVDFPYPPIDVSDIGRAVLERVRSGVDSSPAGPILRSCRTVAVEEVGRADE